ncbi:MAG: phosphogluconate dehydratase [Pseudomonadota bacterium]
MSALNPILRDVTDRIRERSAASRAAYLAAAEQAARTWPARQALSCTNIAHGLAAAPASDKLRLREIKPANLAIVTSYNDMLSAHQPYGRYPEILKQAAREAGAVAQVASGVPAMCDGITQGQPGMELSLFSRDVIALSSAVGLSHNTFDGALWLGVCDKIVPGLLIAALRFGHLPSVFVPAGPMGSGISNSEKSRVRQRFYAGEATREELLSSELAAYHSAGTCTFYGTANSNQLLMEFMGLHVPGAAFVPHDSGLRDALSAKAATRLVSLTATAGTYRPISKIVDECALVNAIVGLLATGGSSNHTIHLVAIARAAGLVVDWDDFDALSRAVPLLARVYPNGKADINQFHAAGGVGTILNELLQRGLLHPDVKTVVGDTIADYAQEPLSEGGRLVLKPSPAPGQAPDIIASADAPFAAEGGLRLVAGNLGRAVVKVSAVDPARHVIEAPARVFDSQAAVHEAFAAGELDRDVVVVVRGQGPRANGMPELHKLMPPLTILQDRGFRVALVTDGRLSGASGVVPAALHVSPEAAAGGTIARVYDGDTVRVDCDAGTLSVCVSDDILIQRDPCTVAASEAGLGREMLAVFRDTVSSAEQGASVIRTECDSEETAHVGV